MCKYMIETNEALLLYHYYARQVLPVNITIFFVELGYSLVQVIDLIGDSLASNESDTLELTYLDINCHQLALPQEQGDQLLKG